MIAFFVYFFVVMVTKGLFAKHFSICAKSRNPREIELADFATLCYVGTAATRRANHAAKHYIRCIIVLAQLSSKPYFLRHNFCGGMSKVGPNPPAAACALYCRT